MGVEISTKNSRQECHQLASCIGELGSFGGCAVEDIVEVWLDLLSEVGWEAGFVVGCD